MADPYLQRTVDADGQHRARTCGANHEPLMAITEGIKDQRDVETALIRTAEALLLDDDLADRLEPDVFRYLERRGIRARPGYVEVSCGCGRTHAIDTDAHR